MFSPKTLLGSTLAIATLCSIQTLFAQNYYVGTCKPGKGTFYTSIQQAVTEAPSGTIINICPGTYAEQVTIQQPLTLKGMQNGNSTAVIITTPGGGLSPFPDSNSFGGAAQLQVINSGGPVNISGIVVDGTGVTNNTVAGILYESSPGVVDHVITRNLADPVTKAYGILVLDDGALSPTVTIQNSFLTHQVASGSGATVFAAASNMSANIANNYISLPGSNAIGIHCATQAPGTITGNVISADEGIRGDCPSGTISGNTITGQYGITLGIRATINGNTINTTLLGINAGVDRSSVIKGNQIFNAGVGINLVCVLPATISGNQFIGTAVGLANVPTTTLDKTAGNFFGVPTIQQLCSN
jgi:nitrous oxidase accessory protein NosD